LPFEKRNVEIFMYATLLENEDEEAVDLYIYRQAEYKAIKIGKISRLLKETAVDCILNHDQTNFTQEIMEEHRESEVTQHLSSGKVILDFKVGDTPYSATCDYMESCDYKCLPHKADEEITVKDASYGAAFIMMNFDTIRTKIRTLFKEKFFYKKESLIAAISMPRQYPLIQIFAALTQMVDDPSEIISDKYGRTGTMVNIGNYYLFQPAELSFFNASIFNRVVPIDFKHDTIQVYADAVAPEGAVTVAAVASMNAATKLWDELRSNYSDAITAYGSNAKIGKRIESFYPYCGKAMQILVRDFGAGEDDLIDFLVAHLIDTLAYAEKILLLRYVYTNAYRGEDVVESKVKTYFESLIVTGIAPRYTLGLPLCEENGDVKVLHLNGSTWENAEPQAEEDIMAAYELRWRLKLANISLIIGSIGSENKARYMVFKTVTRSAKRNTGARCDQAGKAKKIQMLNAIIGVDTYNKENTKALLGDELCAMQELLLRFYDKEKKDDKSWFFSYEETILFKNALK